MTRSVSPKAQTELQNTNYRDFTKNEDTTSVEVQACVTRHISEALLII